MNVIPNGPEQTEWAITALAERAGWHDPITAEVRHELIGWFDHDWSAQAILVALDRKPDNNIQRRRGDREDLHDYLKARLRYWFDDSPDADSVSARLAPPRPGQTFEQWWRVHRRNNHQSARRAFRPLSEQGKQAREHALRLSRSKTTTADRVARARASDAKRQAAMELLAPAKEPAQASDDVADILSAVDQIDTRHKLTANYAGRRALIINHPRVRAIIDRAAHARRPLTTSEQAVLRNAVHDAKLAGASAQLEAWSSDSGEILSPEGLRMLAYLNNAFEEDLPFDALIAIITTVVESGSRAW